MRDRIEHVLARLLRLLGRGGCRGAGRLLGFLFSHFLVPQTLPGGAFNFTACLRGPFLVRALVRVR